MRADHRVIAAYLGTAA
ncbi:MAG: hypothetical protein ACI4XG_29205 [Bradyrhizobium sp.]